MKKLLTTILTVVLAGGAAFLLLHTPQTTNSNRQHDSVAASQSDALTTLNSLTVKGRAPKTGYSRAQFGQAWADVDHNGCDTRNDILKRDLTDVTVRKGGCVVHSGRLVSPYTGETITFRRGNQTSELVPIDHIVALSDAWQKGAQQLSLDERTALANDPLNLLAVDKASNTQKSDADAATWLPPNKSFRCDYVSRQVAVKAKYRLWVTPAEKQAITEVLQRCS
ncbi:HNH endonuclease family protein [Arcanobacterium bovis]